MQITIEITDESQLSHFFEVIRGLSYARLPKSALSKRKLPKATLDIEKFDEATRQGIAETLDAYRTGNKAYFQQTWEPEYMELKKELLDAGVALCGE